MPRIAHISALWSLAGHPSPRGEWTLERKMIAAAAGRGGYNLTGLPRSWPDAVVLRARLGALWAAGRH